MGIVFEKMGSWLRHFKRLIDNLNRKTTGVFVSLYARVTCKKCRGGLLCCKVVFNIVKHGLYMINITEDEVKISQ